MKILIHYVHIIVMIEASIWGGGGGGGGGGEVSTRVMKVCVYVICFKVATCIHFNMCLISVLNTVATCMWWE